MKKFLILVVFAIFSMLILISPAHAARSKQQATPTGTPLIVGIGQSNMSGAYTIPNGMTPTSLPNVKMMKFINGTWQWVAMKEPSSVWGGNTQYYDAAVPLRYERYGASTAFMARLMALKPSWTRAGFINCGVGGSSITTWLPRPDPGLTEIFYPKTNFDHCWDRIEQAFSDGYYLAGVVIINGETDTNTLAYSSAYVQTFRDLYGVISTRVNNPNLPLVFAKLGVKYSIGTHPSWDKIRGYQQNSLYGSNPYWRMSNTDDLARETTDGLHYLSNIQYDTLGLRLANQFNTIP